MLDLGVLERCPARIDAVPVEPIRTTVELGRVVCDVELRSPFVPRAAGLRVRRRAAAQRSRSAYLREPSRSRAPRHVERTDRGLGSGRSFPRSPPSALRAEVGLAQTALSRRSGASIAPSAVRALAVVGSGT